MQATAESTKPCTFCAAKQPMEILWTAVKMVIDKARSGTGRLMLILSLCNFDHQIERSTLDVSDSNLGLVGGFWGLVDVRYQIP